MDERAMLKCSSGRNFDSNSILTRKINLKKKTKENFKKSLPKCEDNPQKIIHKYSVSVQETSAISIDYTTIKLQTKINTHTAMKYCVNFFFFSKYTFETLTSQVLSKLPSKELVFIFFSFHELCPLTAHPHILFS